MVYLRKSADRGAADHGWLKTQHTFSFADYYDPKHMSFGPLRVINEDFIQGQRGFPTHGHANMEIISYVVGGELSHKDTLGNETKIVPGEVQRMSAGTGIRHSEANEGEGWTHLLQIWIEPEKSNIKPSYGQKKFDFSAAKDLTLAVSKGGRDGAVDINQDVDMYVGKWTAGQQSELKIRHDRRVWFQLIKGDLTVNGNALSAGDGLGIAKENLAKFKTEKGAEFLLFDLQ